MKSKEVGKKWKDRKKKGVAELFDCHFVLADNNTKFKGYES